MGFTGFHFLLIFFLYFFLTDLRPSRSYIREKFDYPISDIKVRRNINLFATRLVVVFNSTHITVGQHATTVFDFGFTSPLNDTRLIVQLESVASATWTIFSQCEDPFVLKTVDTIN